jgi:hypothetical protein
MERKEAAMRTGTCILTALVLATSLDAQQPSSPAPRATPLVGNQAPAPEPPLEIWAIDLDPSGQTFSFGKPALEGDVYVFTAWPERKTARLSRTKVKKVTQRTKDINQELVYRVDLVPTGRVIARENPVLKGKTYVLKTWRDGTLMSLRKEDIKAITRVTGIPAFRIQQEERGGARIDNLPMEGGGMVTILPGGEPAAAEPAQAQPDPNTGNWLYMGEPGVTDAYAPPSAVVASPGDVPKAAPTPQPPR